MYQQARRHTLALFLTLAVANLGFGQTMPAVPGVQAAPAAQPWHMDPFGPAASVMPTDGCTGGPAACAPYEDRNGPLLIGNPLLDGAPGTPGWVAGLDVGIIVPHITNHLVAPVTLSNGVTSLVHLPTADLGVQAMPKIELGYRPGQAAGEITVSYRFVVADGSQFVSPGDLPPFAPTGAALRSRLNLQTLDLDYGNYEPRTIFGWGMKWRVGLRGMMVYSDSQGADAVLAEQTTNRYWGVGPHASLDLRHEIAGTGLALFGRIEGSMPFGRLTQRYIEAATGPGGAIASGETDLYLNVSNTTLNFQAGVCWTPPWSDRLHLTAGYTYEYFWNLGALGTGTAPREELGLQGGFIRAEWNY